MKGLVLMKPWVLLQHHFKVAMPLMLAIFIAVLAIHDRFARKYGSDEIKVSNRRKNSLD